MSNGVTSSAGREYMDYVERYASQSGQTLKEVCGLNMTRQVGYSYGLTNKEMSEIERGLMQ